MRRPCFLWYNELTERLSETFFKGVEDGRRKREEGMSDEQTALWYNGEMI